MNDDNVVELINVPREWPSCYDAESREYLGVIIEWLNDDRNKSAGWTLSTLARKARVAIPTLSLVLRGKYDASPVNVVKKVLAVISADLRHEHRRAGEMPFVETSIYKMVVAACHRARLYRSIAVVSAYVGTGKTTALKQYALRTPDTILIEAIPEMTSSVLLDFLVEATDATVHKADRYSRGTKADRMVGVLNALRLSGRLVILDEAETTTPSCLEYIRRVCDLAQVGVVLAGTEKLEPLVRDSQGRFGQISSRGNLWQSARSITADDAYMLTRAALHDVADLPDDVLDAFWQACDGSARVLCNGIIPGVRDYGIKQGLDLTADLVHHVAQQVLGFRRRRSA